MKKKIIAILAMFLVICLAISTIQAATASVSIKSSSMEVKAGDTFTFTIYAQSADGINGFSTELDYDNTKLDIKDKSLVDTTNWSFLGTDNKIDVLYNSSTQITSADVYKITFQVKSDVAVGTKINVGIKQTLVDSNAKSNSTVNLDPQYLTITVTDSTSNNPGNNTTDGNSTEEPPNGNNTNNGNNGNNGNSGNNGNNGNSSNNGNSLNNIKNNTNGNSSNTTKNNRLPQTGLNSIITVLIVTVGIVAYIFYKKYNNYKNI